LFVGVCLAVLRPWSAEHAPRLNYRVNDREPPDSGYLLVPESAETLLTFSDGSKVSMSPRARGRVVDLGSSGARFALESGRASVNIVPRQQTLWTFDVGPFVVSVHGTSFDVAWDPTEALFELELVTGSVSVTSPINGPEIRLRAGQTLRVNLRDRTSTIATGAVGNGTPQTTERASSPSRPSVPEEASAPPAAWSHRGWSNMVAEGKAMVVLADAETSGLKTVLEQADGDDLWALANAARYVGRFGVASQALVMQRTRFPSSARSREAAFLLGRLYDRDSEGPAKALKWYDRYLAEAPNGAHVSDALGRKITLLERWNRREEAVALAEEYLRRFPSGTYARAARALLQATTVRR
jgi:TolA-binding protein